MQFGDACYDGLNWAVKYNREEMVEYLLTNVYIGDNRHLVNRLMNYDSRNAMHHASTFSIIKMLIEIGKADQNIPDRNGLYLIHRVVSDNFR